VAVVVVVAAAAAAAEVVAAVAGRSRPRATSLTSSALPSEGSCSR